MRVKDRPILWEPNSDLQKAFLACSARTALIGGGAGGGKTSALLAAAAAQTANPRHRACIFRKDFPSLKHIISASFPLFLPLGATYNKQEHTWRFPKGSTIEFSHLEDETAVYQHAGKEYSFLGFDELQQLAGDDRDSQGQPINHAFAYLQSRLRAPKDSGLRLEVRATAMPGGPGMGWCKAYFRIPDSGDSTEFVDEVTGFRRCYFKSTVEDNPALAGTDYHRQLLNLPSAQRKALLFGDWSSYAGQVFDEWVYQRHVCDEFAVPASWDIYRACDDGFRAPACVLWLAHDRDVRDTIYVIAELYASGQTPEMMASRILKIDRSLQIDIGDEIIDNDEPLDGVIDSAAFSDNGTGSRGHEMNRLGCRWKPAEKGAGSRLAGISAIHQRLAQRSDGTVGLKIFRGCKNLIRTLPELTYDPKNPEDIDDSCEDHAVDCLRYGLTRKRTYFRRVRVIGI